MNRRRLTHAAITTTLALLALAMTSPSRADDPPAPPPSSSPANTPAPSERDLRDAMRERMRTAIRRQLTNMELRRQRLEHAMRMLNDGRPLSELREQFGDLSPIWDSRPGPDAGPPGQGADADSGPDQSQGQGQGQVHPIDQLDRPLPGGEPDAMGAGGPGPRHPGGPGAGERDGEGPPGAPRRNRPGRGGGGGGGGAGGEGRERGPDAPQGPVDIGAKELAFVEEFLASSAPLILERFKELEKRDPEEARRRFIAMFPRVRFLYEMRERDPALFELRLKDIRFAREALEAARRAAETDTAAAGGQANADERQKHVTRLKTALSEQYKARTEILKRDLARAREHSEKLSTDIEKRPGAESAMVESFAKSMIEREKVRMERRGHRPVRDEPDMPGEQRDPQPRPD